MIFVACDGVRRDVGVVALDDGGSGSRRGASHSMVMLVGHSFSDAS